MRWTLGLAALLWAPGCTLLTGFLDPVCGDGVADLDQGEECDDGNNLDGDGCQADCSLLCNQDGALDAGENCLAFSSVETGGAPRALAAADLDADGDLDLAISSEDGQIFLLQNEAGVFSVSATLDVGGSSSVLVAADVDRDGLPDLAFADEARASVFFLPNLDGTFPLGAQEVALGGLPRGIVAADASGDGLDDLVIANPLTGSLFVLRQSLGQGFVDAPNQIFVAQAPLFVAALDGDENEFADFLTFDQAGGGAALVLLDGFDAANNVFSFTDFGVVLPSASIDPAAMIAVELDGSAASPELLVADPLNNTIELLAVELGLQNTFAVGAAPESAAAGDVNGDGLADLVSADTGDNTVSLLAGEADITLFGPRSAIPVGQGPRGVLALDLDGNGFVDIATAEAGGTVSILLNLP